MLGCATATNTNTTTNTQDSDLQKQTSDITTNSIKNTQQIQNSTRSEDEKVAKTATAKNTTKITTQAISSKPGSSITLKANITSKNKPVNTGSVAFKINKKTIKTTKVSNGTAQIKYTIPTNFKDTTYTINIVYGENSKYTRSEATSKLTLTQPKVIKTATKPTATTRTKVTSITDFAGKTVTLKATVYRITDSYVKVGKVAFKINGKSVGTANVKNGVAQLRYKIPTSFKNAEYTITAVYGQYGEFKRSEAKGTLYLNNVRDTKITITKNKTTIFGNDKIQLKAKIIDAKNGKLVTKGRIVFKINGVTLKTVDVKNGYATLNWVIPSKYSGKYPITAKYGQCGKFKSSQQTMQTYIYHTSYKSYLAVTKNCQVNSSYFKKIVKNKISGKTTTYSQAVTLFNYANARLKYSGYYNTRYGAEKTCRQAFGNCCDMAHVVVALSRTAGIPARYNHAKCYFTSGLVTGHVWAEICVDGKWYKCDATSSRNSFGVIKNWYKSGSIKHYTSLKF